MRLCEGCKNCELAKRDSLYVCSDNCTIPWHYLNAIEDYNINSITKDELIDKIHHIVANDFKG